MKASLDEQELEVYASAAQTVQEPLGSDYTQGVRVGKTIPAKWWNWLFKAVTSRVRQAYEDVLDIFTELKNVIVGAGITPSAEDNTQLSGSISTHTNLRIAEYTNPTPFSVWAKGVHFMYGQTVDSARDDLSDITTPVKVGQKAFSTVLDGDSGRVSLIYSDDGEFWVHSGLFCASFGVVYNDGLYYVLMIDYVSGPASTMRLKVTRDFISYTDLLSFSVSTLSDAPLPRTMLVKAGSSVYLLDAYDDNTYLISGNSATIIQGLVDAKDSYYGLSTVPRWISYEALYLAQDSYVICNKLFRNNLWSTLVLVTSHADAYNFPSVKLRNGIVIGSKSPDMYIVNADGLLTQISGVISAGYDYIYDIGDGLIVRISGNRYGIIYGDNVIHNLPSSVLSCVRFGSTYYICRADKVYSIENTISDDLSNYTEIATLERSDYVIHKICEDNSMHALLFEYVYGGVYHYKVSLDYGQTLVSMRYTDGQEVVRFRVKRGKIFDHIYSNGLLTDICRHNRVSGGTIYLR